MPVEFDLRCSDGEMRRYLWHRRYDAEEKLMYIAGEEAGAGVPPAPAK